jgi:hypothetical protein
MRRLITALAIAGLFAFRGAPVMADSAGHTSIDPTGAVIDCGTNTYTITSGTFDVVFHFGTSPSGNFTNSATLTSNNVIAEDAAGNLYSVRGIFHFGGTTNANIDNGPFHFEAKLQIVGQGGGTIDSVNVVLAISPWGGEADLDFGTCVPL